MLRDLAKGDNIIAPLCQDIPQRYLERSKSPEQNQSSGNFRMATKGGVFLSGQPRDKAEIPGDSPTIIQGYSVRRQDARVEGMQELQRDYGRILPKESHP